MERALENGRLEPETPEELREIVAEAVSSGEPLSVEGHGSKRGLGRPVQAARTVSTARMSGINFYEPEELVLSARAGTPIAEIEALLAGRNQRFDFEPMDYGPLHGLEPGLGTIGGVVAANLSGPRRLKQGAARDHVLGLAAVSGRAEIFRAGGRVVKNVTGYDLARGLTGSFGTLAIFTDLTLKTMPRTETETTLLVRGLDDEAAIGALAAAMGSSGEVSGAAHLPYGIAAGVLSGELGRDAATLVRLEGFGPSVAARSAYLGDALGRVGRLERLEGEVSAALWRDVRDVSPFHGEGHRAVWRISTAPTAAPAFVMNLRMHVGVEALYDWQGGLVWLRVEHGIEAERIRGMLAASGGGHATLVRASEAERAATPVFQPQAPALAGLSQRMRDQFDPAGILNPGRMG